VNVICGIVALLGSGIAFAMPREGTLGVA